MKVLYNQQISGEKWRFLIKDCLYTTPFQEPYWFTFHKELQDKSQSPFSVAIEEENGELFAVISGLILKETGLKAVLTKRAVITGGMLVRNGDQEVNNSVTNLISGLDKYLKTQGVIYGEIRNLNDYSRFKEDFNLNGWQYEPHLNFHVDCKNKELMWNNLSTGRKRDIKYGEKKGVVTRLATTEKDIEKWYKILFALYKEKVKTPLPCLDYFKKSLIRPNARLIIVEYQGNVIGGLFGELTPGRVFCDLFCCGLDEEYKTERVYPSILGTWAAMELANKEGIARFDFMGAGKPGVHYGVRDFKAKFGGELVEHGRFVKVFSPTRYAIGKMAIKLKKSLL